MAFRGTGEEPAVHVAWRLRLAQEIEGAYGPAPTLAVLAAAGSVGAGYADRWSDLEVDCYWREPPSDADRLRPVRALAGDLAAYWEYDDGDREWSEEYQLRGLTVTVSNFTVATVEEFLGAVLDAGDLDPAKHYRLAALGGCRALRGAGMLAAWRDRLGRYPDTLAAAVVESCLRPDRFPGWSVREALVERGDTIAVHALLAAVSQGVFSAVLATNRAFQPHRLPKWQRQLLGGLPHRPRDLEARLEQLWHQQPRAAVASAEALVSETLELAERELGVRFDSTRADLAEQRRALDPPGQRVAGQSRPPRKRPTASFHAPGSSK